MRELRLPLKSKYFEQIKSGRKKWEYREITPYWMSRLSGRFDRIVLTKGYPTNRQRSRRLVRPWRGFKEQYVALPLFGPKPVLVYAIRVN